MCSVSDFAGEGDDVGVWACDGVCAPPMSIPGMSRLFGAGRALLFRRTVALTFRFAFRPGLGLAFGFDMSMPGMSCPRCCARAAGTPAVIKTAAAASEQILVGNACRLFITPPGYGLRAARADYNRPGKTLRQSGHPPVCAWFWEGLPDVIVI
jgi:hypothetical protein